MFDLLVKKIHSIFSLVGRTRVILKSLVNYSHANTAVCFLRTYVPTVHGLTQASFTVYKLCAMSKLRCQESKQCVPYVRMQNFVSGTSSVYGRFVHVCIFCRLEC